MIPGHEMIGSVAAIGPGEKKWKVGDRVGGPWHGGHDGNAIAWHTARGAANFHAKVRAKPAIVACSRCATTEPSTVSIGMVDVRGPVSFPTRKPAGYADVSVDAEYCDLRSEAVVAVPSDVDPAAFCPLLCAGVTVFNSMRQQHISPGETVAVQGLGGLGHLAIQYASKMGYRTVALSSSGVKEEFARDLGATDYIDGSKEDHSEGLQRLGGASLIVATAPDPSILGKLVTGLGVLGKLLILARMMRPPLVLGT